jgi:hypothetical protein
LCRWENAYAKKRQAKESVRISPFCLTLPGRTPGGVAVMPFGWLPCFLARMNLTLWRSRACLSGFTAAFYTAGYCGAKKGGLDGLGKLRSGAEQFCPFDFFRAGSEYIFRAILCENPKKVFKKVINFIGI